MYVFKKIFKKSQFAAFLIVLIVNWNVNRIINAKAVLTMDQIQTILTLVFWTMDPHLGRSPFHLILELPLRQDFARIQDPRIQDWWRTGPLTIWLSEKHCKPEKKSRLLSHLIYLFSFINHYQNSDRFQNYYFCFYA